MNYFEFTGKTVDEAIEIGLKELNVAREDVTVEVLEEGKKKLFSSVKARVKLGVKTEEQVNEATETVVEECKECANTATCDELTDGQRAVEFLDGLFEVLNFTATAELVKEDEKIEINVTAKNTTEVIGKHGATIDAIQTLARLQIRAEINISEWLSIVKTTVIRERLLCKSLRIILLKKRSVWAERLSLNP